MDPAAVRQMFRDFQSPELVVHLAAEGGGIGANQRSPGRFFYANAMMGLHMIEEARRAGVGKFLQAGTVCSYPAHAPTPFIEDYLFTGEPEPTNRAYGVAKLSLLYMLQAYRQQYGMNGIYLVPINLYGPGDDFNTDTSHVVPALIRKCVEAREAGADHIEVWGSGNASREFLYAPDCAEAIVKAAEFYNSPEPVNVGTGRETTIREAARMIAELTGFRGGLRFNATKPDGQLRRRLDTSRATAEFGFQAKTSLEDGLRNTVRWFEENRH